MSRIAIIGAGLSGRLLALNLLRFASSDAAISVRMLDRGDERDMGPAYSYEADYLLLNVPAGRMGAFPEDPEHFLTWNRDRGAHAGPWDFLPRRLYRDYILALVREALQARAGGTTFEHVRGEVTDIDTEGGCATIHVEDKGPIVVDKAVLALGNFPPRHPPIENRSALESERYIRNPWDPGVLDCLSRRDTVFLIGTGQTTVDLAVALHRRAHEGRIIALSRRGLLPLAHGGFDPYESFFEEVKESKTILDTFRIVCKHLDRAESMGIDKRAVIDSLRPDTQTIWLGLSRTRSAGSFVISFVTGRSFVAEFRRRAKPSSTRCADPGSSTSWRGGSVTSRSPRRPWRCTTSPAGALGTRSRLRPSSSTVSDRSQTTAGSTIPW